MKITVDRTEGGIAICITNFVGDDNKVGGANMVGITKPQRELVFSLPTELFPAPPREGDVYELSLTPDEAGRAALEKRIRTKFYKLLNKGEDTK